MTDSYPTDPPSRSAGSASGDASSGVKEKIDTAKSQAGDVKDTAKSEARNVAGTAKEEAAHVAGEAKNQAKDLLRQTQQQLKEQAATQQQRVASGLHSVSSELSDMASTSPNQGVASDVVRQVAERADGAASWLDRRDPGSLLTEIKAFARRRPGIFIAGAAAAGVLAGRLTRALASDAKDDSDRAAEDARTAPVVSGTDSTLSSRATASSSDSVYGPAATATSETPIYAERVTSYGTDPVTSDDEFDGGLGATRGGQGR